MGVYLKGVNKEWVDRVLTVAGYRQFFKDDEIIEIGVPHGDIIDGSRLKDALHIMANEQKYHSYTDHILVTAVINSEKILITSEDIDDKQIDSMSRIVNNNVKRRGKGSGSNR